MGAKPSIRLQARPEGANGCWVGRTKQGRLVDDRGPPSETTTGHEREKENEEEMNHPMFNTQSRWGRSESDFSLIFFDAELVADGGLQL